MNDDAIDAILDAEEVVTWELIAGLAEGIRAGGCSYDGCLSPEDRAARLADLAVIAEEVVGVL